MASIKITSYECRKDLLPGICMKCGQPATVRVSHRFAWHPPWVPVLILVNLLIYAIIAMILTKRMTVNMPMCDEHRTYWRKRALWTWLTFAIVVLGSISGIGFLQTINPPQRDEYFSYVCFGSVIGFVAWIILLVVLQSTAIKPKMITEHSITLVKVHQDFIDQLKQERDDEFENDEYHD